MKFLSISLIGLLAASSKATPMPADAAPDALHPRGTCPGNFVNHDHEYSSINRGGSYVSDCQFIANTFKKNSKDSITFSQGGLAPGGGDNAHATRYTYNWNACTAYIVYQPSTNVIGTLKQSTAGFYWDELAACLYKGSVVSVVKSSDDYKFWLAPSNIKVKGL